ncbi:hypothetical protein CAPTEDRAFT_224546 [Capitella teleta]|uniref:Cytochrome b-c1 complex subunit Rieske, mitochondrial n=1 Tax=Capitella teleta TaxID=283909 RepID=R7TZW0_CAPTE|nr:hypothetical protein CAPTEDRAFT_224546 [Capitella teleta]|eukprot:ELT96936.1 hypothetical protein CAPTEDRAFT_224546 [Capitella teleta]
MQGVAARSSGLAQVLKATARIVPSKVEPLGAAVIQESLPFIEKPASKTHSNYALASQLPPSGFLNPRVMSGIGVSCQYRLAHTDLQVPDFDYYRKAPKEADDSIEGDNNRKAFTYLMLAGAGAPALYGTKTVITQFVSSMSASADVLALAKIEINLDEIPEGKNVTFKWRGKPLFVRHRTAEEVDKEAAVDVGSLRDPQHDTDRVKNPEWLIILGVCTHLGCVPMANAGDYGGYYCPCHGSHYDASGRIRAGPAPLNLEVPYYEFVEDNLLVVG